MVIFLFNLLATNTDLSVTKPPISNSYCSDAGTAILVDKNLICKCNKGFEGINCHIDSNSALQLNNAFSI